MGRGKLGIRIVVVKDQDQAARRGKRRISADQARRGGRRMIANLGIVTPLTKVPNPGSLGQIARTR